MVCLTRHCADRCSTAHCVTVSSASDLESAAAAAAASGPAGPGGPLITKPTKLRAGRKHQISSKRPVAGWKGAAICCRNSVWMKFDAFQTHTGNLNFPCSQRADLPQLPDFRLPCSLLFVGAFCLLPKKNDFFFKNFFFKKRAPV